MKVLKLIYLLVMTFVVIQEGFSQQVKSFEILSRSTITEDFNSDGASEPLLNHETHIIGTTLLRKDNHSFFYDVSMNNGKKCSIEALSSVLYNEKADRLITYGSSLHSHIVSQCQIRLYSGDGQLIRDLGLAAVFPFKLVMVESGEFYLTGNAFGDSTGFILEKYSKEGLKIWSKSIPISSSRHLSISKKGQVIGIELEEAGLRFFNSDGEMISENSNFNSISSIRFLGEEKVIINIGKQIYVYEVSSQQLLFYKHFPGYILAEKGIALSPDESVFAILSLGNSETNEGCSIHAFNSEGNLINEISLSEQAKWQTYSFIKFHSEDEFSTFFGKEIIRLKINP